MEQLFSEQIGELTSALSKAQNEFSSVIKDAANPFYKSKYAPLPAYIDAAKGALAKHGLAVMQPTVIQDGQLVLVTILSHSSGQWVRGFYPLNPVKNDPQGLGSAMTYARRYCFSSILQMASDNDDDGEAAHGRDNKIDKPKYNAPPELYHGTENQKAIVKELFHKLNVPRELYVKISNALMTKRMTEAESIIKEMIK